MPRINKNNKVTPVEADEILIYDSEDTSDDKNITLGQVATFTENQNSTVAGTKIFSSGVDFQKGFIAYGQYSPLPTGIGSYVAGYTHPTYGARLLGYNGVTYQDLAIGSMPTAGSFSIKSLANGDCNFGYNVNVAEDLGVTGNVTANKYYGDGSNLTNIKTVVPLGTSTTASATAEKAVTLSGFVLSTGATIQVTFTNTNTNTTPTLNVNSTGAKAIYNEAGTAVSATNPAYFKAGSTVEFTYNGTNWIFKKRVIENYINGTSWYRIYSDGWVEQGGKTPNSAPVNVTLLVTLTNNNYTVFVTTAGYGYQRLCIENQLASGFTIGQEGVYVMYWECKGY